jgi:hypothetical protein
VPDTVLIEIGFDPMFSTGLAMIADIGEWMAFCAIFEAYHLPVCFATFGFVQGGTAGNQYGGN